ncbi:MAG: transglutaminase-like cysteine peptidase [Sneathiellales bacterium]|nr:transglutaminase-like cysteine peptidase [Sneathiellales bacterium]
MLKPFLLSTFMTGTALLGIPEQALAASNNVPNDAKGLFGTIEIASDNLQSLPQWRKVVSSFPELSKTAAQCDADIQDCKSQQMTLWRAKIRGLELSDPSIQIREINQFINRWKQAADTNTVGKKDHWATPLEFIPIGGDSEDFAIMKYISLKELGIDPSKMRIVVTNDVLRGVTHTILVVKYGKRTLILDSQNDTVLPEKLVQYYIPFYSVNETTRWAHIPKQTASVAAGTDKND